MKPHELALLCTLVLGLAIATDCSTRTSAYTRVASCCATNLEPSVGFTDKSLYQIESVWTTDGGKRIKLSSLRGRAQVVVMFFASCQSACPLLVQDLKRIEAALPQKVAAETGFVLLSFDNENDTPEALRVFRARHQLSPGPWMLLRGEPDDTLEIAALLGVKYKKRIGGQFAHSNLITVLNSEGEIIHQQVGLAQDTSATIKAIELSYNQSRVCAFWKDPCRSQKR